LEARDHAQARGRKPYAALSTVAAGRSKRGAALDPALDTMLREVGGEQADLAISGASGAHEATAAEAAVLERHAIPARGWSTLTGHLRDAQFPFSVALAALCISEGTAFPPLDDVEQPAHGVPKSVLATTVGYHYLEGMALITAAN
jgi:3-oxoacyl-[acyl-carrier-protein] synthase II